MAPLGPTALAAPAIGAPALAADSEPAAPGSNPTKILESFARAQPQPTGKTLILDHEKQVIMFSIGAVLLTLLISTASVGIAMGLFGKRLFVAHTLLAGLTVTLALIHVVVGLVWFYPF